MLNLNGKETFTLLPSNFLKFAGLETLIPFPWKRKCSFSDIEINEANYIFEHPASPLILCFRLHPGILISLIDTTVGNN